MKRNTIKRLIMALILTLGGLISLPSYSWPEVDHMNMCGAAAKVDRTYGGNFKGWAARDQFVTQKRRAGAYYRANCPKTVAPVKKVAKKKVYAKKEKRTYKKKVVRKVRIAKSSKAKSFRKKVKYDEHADCVRVDRMNGYGSAVKVVRRR